MSATLSWEMYLAFLTENKGNFEMKKQYIISLHILAWLLFIAGDALALISVPEIKAEGWWSGHREVWLIIISAIYLITGAIALYGVSKVVLPLFFKKKQYRWAVLSVLGLPIAIIVSRYIIEFWILKPYFGWDNYSKNTNFMWSWYVSNCLLYNVRYVIWGVVYFFIVEWYENTTRQKTLEREKTHAELAFLKSQINPHFLFNTINDIYALAYVKDENAPTALLKLSGMLRYMLHESNTNFVPLEKELDYVKDFIDLQNIGFKGNTNIRFSTEGNISKPQIAPMLLIPFVENAFKHGDFNNSSQPIEVLCRFDNQKITFQCKNVVRLQQKDALGGIGLQNVRRRLNLLYPHKHQLDIVQAEGLFKCTLILETN
jgi:two-component system, LytTR family, sensor kinase